jgi:hypothetical protein
MYAMTEAREKPHSSLDDAPLSRDRLQQMTGLDDGALRGAIDDAVDGGWITRCAADGSLST